MNDGLLALTIASCPTDGPRSWPDDLEGCVPEFSQFKVMYFGTVGDWSKGSSGGYGLHPVKVGLDGVFTFQVFDYMTPIGFGGERGLFYEIDVQNRTYEVLEDPDESRFYMEDYLGDALDDRMSVTFYFKKAEAV